MSLQLNAVMSRFIPLVNVLNARILRHASLLAWNGFLRVAARASL